MNPSGYSDEQREDINERVKKAAKLLEELHLKPEAAVQAVNTGNDTFAMKVICYLQDTRYQMPKL